MHDTFDGYLVANELYELEKKAEDFTITMMNVVQDLYDQNYPVWARRFEENILFAWHIMQTSNGWHIDSLDEDWTLDAKEQQEGIHHLDEARIHVSRTAWWMERLKEYGNIIEKEYAHSLYVEVLTILEKAKEINRYFQYFIEREKSNV